MSADEVLNGASYQSAQLDAGIAPGSIFVIPGRGLGPGELNVASQPYPTRLPDEAAGTEVAFRNTETGEAYQAPLIHSVDFQVSGIVPPGAPPGPYSATVSYQGNSASTAEFLVVPSAPGLFALSMRGFGPGVIQNYESPGSTPLNQLTHPAVPEGHLIIWGTGLGEASASAGNGSIAVAAEKDVWVEFENQRIRPSYAGPAPGFPGLDQINVPLPAWELSARGCYVPFRVIANGTASNTVTASISETPGTCEHPLGFSTETLRRLDMGGTVSIGEIVLARQAGFATNLIPGAGSTGSGTVYGTFYRADAARVVLTSVLSRRDSPLGCRLAVGLGGGIVWVNASAFPQGLDAGTSLTATGPAGQTLWLERPAEIPFFVGNYVVQEALPGNALQPGNWKIAGTGGTAVGPFDADVTVLPRFLISYPSSVRRDAPVTVSWPTAGLQDSQIVTIDLSVDITEPGDEFGSTTRSAGAVSCRVPARTGRLTIPADLMQTLPSEHDGTGFIHFGIESVPAVFQAEGLDYGVARMNLSETRSVKVE